MAQWGNTALCETGESLSPRDGNAGRIYSPPPALMLVMWSICPRQKYGNVVTGIADMTARRYCTASVCSDAKDWQYVMCTHSIMIEIREDALSEPHAEHLNLANRSPAGISKTASIRPICGRYSDFVARSARQADICVGENRLSSSVLSGNSLLWCSIAVNIASGVLLTGSGKQSLERKQINCAAAYSVILAA